MRPIDTAGPLERPPVIQITGKDMTARRKNTDTGREQLPARVRNPGRLMSKLKALAIAIFACAAVTACMLLQGGVASAAGRGQAIVELQQADTSGHTTSSEFGRQAISGTDTLARQAYKFGRVREGRDFTYVISNLDGNAPYRVEYSFVEHKFFGGGVRIFNVFLQSSHVLSALDVYSQAGGANVALQYTFDCWSDANGRVSTRLRSTDGGCADNAMVSTIRVYQDAGTLVEISASASRNKSTMPIRFQNSAYENLYETLLGRLGSRMSLDLAPQRLAARFSTLGTGTGDLSDLVMGLDDGTMLRCLPFTDRYPLFDQISQRQSMTSTAYSCYSPASNLQMSVTFRAPFYPRNEKISSAPFLYVDVTIRNNGSSPANGKFIYSMPQKKDFAAGAPATFSTAGRRGLEYSTSYSSDDESMSPYQSRGATEALALPAGEAGDVAFRGATQPEFQDFASDRLWGYVSPAGYPNVYNVPDSPVYSFYPRGYVGALWTISGLAPGAAQTKHFVMAGFTSDAVLCVKNNAYTDYDNRFRYTTMFSSVQKVVDYAVSNRWAGDGIQEKSEFFDASVGDDSMFYADPAYKGSVRDLVAYSFQSFLINTWWTRSGSGRDWFSVWEGTDCRYHSTVDVEYNNAWFYYQYWPGLLKQVMDEWLLYQKTAEEGAYLSHDMGYNDDVSGQSYPRDMPVEENCDYILMLYKYWKTTGDTGYMTSRFATARNLAYFVMQCDKNGNGMPDIHCGNTVDDGSAGIQSARDQIYLGVKCASAYKAVKEMAQVAWDPQFIGTCQSKIEQINETLEQDSWLSDHYAVALNGGMNEDDRQAYSIFPSNGLNYLLSGTRDPGLTATNIARLKTDLANSTARTLKEFGCTHSSYDAQNEWVSQNLWRDQVACRMGVRLEGASPLAMTGRYWASQQFFARYMDGGFWDVVVYPGGRALANASTRAQGGPRIYKSAGSGYAGYGQSLGYYPRGAASLGLFDAAAGIVLDRPGNSLYYNASTSTPLRVPLLSLADWSNPDPSKRIPTMIFPGGATPPTITNRNLLPGVVGASTVLETSIEGGQHAITPDEDGVNDSTTVCYSVPSPSTVSVTIWKSDQAVRTLTSGASQSGFNSVAWDGRDDSGNVVQDGVYRARVDATAWDGSLVIRPASTEVWVNGTVPNLSTSWYLAEGYTGNNATGGDFEEYVLVQNPSNEAANVEMTFMLPGGATEKRAYTIAAASRFTVCVNDILPNQEVSTYVHSDKNIAVERSMYFSARKAGHDSIGVTSPAKTWYLPEGYTAGDFDEYVLVQNPGEQTANIVATYMTPNAGNVEKKYEVGPHSRFTVHVNDFLPGQEVSTRMESDRPIVVERAQYLNKMKAGTDSIGATSTSNSWYLAEGYTDQGFETYILLQNPDTRYNNAKVTYMMSDGSNRVIDYLLPPESRYTIGVNDLLPGEEISTKIKSQYPIIVERSMYWNKRSDGHDSIATPTPDRGWYAAEGYTAQGFETWELIQNPTDTTAEVTVTFMQPSGKNTVKTYQVAPRSRFTIGVGSILPDTEVSARFTSNVPIIVERAVYFNSRSGGTDSLTIRGL